MAAHVRPIVVLVGAVEAEPPARELEAPLLRLLPQHELISVELFLPGQVQGSFLSHKFWDLVFQLQRRVELSITRLRC